MQVKKTGYNTEKIAKLLAGISVVPQNEQIRMKNRAVKHVQKMEQQLQALYDAVWSVIEDYDNCNTTLDVSISILEDKHNQTKELLEGEE